jgi:acetyltransferase-like isoleucine patch superfamily enzyme
MKNPLSHLRTKFIALFQKMMGTAKFQHDTVGAVFKGFFGRIFQAVAMSYLPMPTGIRVLLQRMKGVSIGKKVFIGPGVYLDPTRPKLLRIEDHVSLAGRITILTHYAPPQPIRELLGPSPDVFKEVTIKRGALIGVNTVILPGVTIGECAMVSAGAVVSKDVPPYAIVSGNPARVIGRIDKKEEPENSS